MYFFLNYILSDCIVSDFTLSHIAPLSVYIPVYLSVGGILTFFIIFVYLFVFFFLSYSSFLFYLFIFDFKIFIFFTPFHPNIFCFICVSRYFDCKYQQNDCHNVFVYMYIKRLLDKPVHPTDLLKNIFHSEFTPYFRKSLFFYIKKKIMHILDFMDIFC